eukprot:CAMPEP_0114236750 /NCGR_PEP_ID=MMETSP0058-20121206/7015_1 /TAXON_ID=36894 /ORGANISM="Pyramimonas parkeae, CCMP726" /LENGTH=346 /DNA_ID=CAMNT_0001348729 /DNA_START=155 /DNA_END=1196 /DNA_ORIENTATION=-
MESRELACVSFIMPMRNAESFLPEVLQSVLDQTYPGPLELCVYDDGSTDSSRDILEEWRPLLKKREIELRITESSPGAPAGGCGKGRNVAIEHSRGDFLCFLDADDIMAPERVEVQLELAQRNEGALVGSRVTRDNDATPRYTRWLNSMSQEQLVLQRLREVPICQPTWFCSRQAFDRVGGYVDDHPNQAEDMIFLYRHVQLGGCLVRADKPLLMYRFHSGSVTGQRAVCKELIWSIRVAELEESFNLIHGVAGSPSGGKEGKRLYRSLCPASQEKVLAFCDVDQSKLARGEFHAHPSKRRIPILHFKAAKPPLLLCVKGDLTGGEFESNVGSLNLREGFDYLHFS